MATRGSLLTGRKLGSAPRAPVVPQRAPVAMAQPRAPVVPQMAPVAMAQPKSPADIARIQQAMSQTMLKMPQQPSGLRALSPQEFQAVPQQPKTAAQAAAFNQPQQPSGLRANPSSLIAMPTQRADENFLKQQEAAMRAKTAQAAQAPQNPSKAMQSYMAAEKAGTAGDMAKPAFKKGGVVKKKPGYAKGGGVVAKKTAASKYAKGGVVASNCGASMKPQQRKK